MLPGLGVGSIESSFFPFGNMEISNALYKSEAGFMKVDKINIDFGNLFSKTDKIHVPNGIATAFGEDKSEFKFSDPEESFLEITKDEGSLDISFYLNKGLVITSNGQEEMVDINGTLDVNSGNGGFVIKLDSDGVLKEFGKYEALVDVVLNGHMTSVAKASVDLDINNINFVSDLTSLSANGFYKNQNEKFSVDIDLAIRKIDNILPLIITKDTEEKSKELFTQVAMLLKKVGSKNGSAENLQFKIVGDSDKGINVNDSPIAELLIEFQKPK